MSKAIYIITILIFPIVSSGFPARKIQYGTSVWPCYPSTSWDKGLKNPVLFFTVLLLNNRSEEGMKTLPLFSLLSLNEPRSRSHVRVSLVRELKSEFPIHGPLRPLREGSPVSTKCWGEVTSVLFAHQPHGRSSLCDTAGAAPLPWAAGAAWWVIAFTNSGLFTLRQISYTQLQSLLVSSGSSHTKGLESQYL